ncbi:MAG: hydantoinase/oxoprolinase family protein [Candidatus Tectomicrobia bacterium]|nr:hydantoinase/oxoprolinase family protein [Candidatus Tectomicrobia bacterium]
MLGIDIGGTFTDLALIDQHNQTLYVGKCLTTPLDPSQGVLQGFTELLQEHRFSPGEISHIIHATTLITNAIIERKGARAGLLTTLGFRDILQIGREMRYDVYDLYSQLPTPLAPRRWRKEVSERITPEGEVSTPLDEEGLINVTRELLDEGVEAIAVVFLHSYLDPNHELQALSIIRREFPHLFVSISSQVAREIREFERTSTTVANAYVQPLAHRYLTGLNLQLREKDFQGTLYIMTSSGGISSLDVAKEFPVRTIESGPAAGAMIGGYIGRLIGEKNVLAFDMGGTTAKIGLVHDGQPSLTHGFEIARVDRFKKGSGFPIRAAATELMEIGAGGGSIARIDDLGLLKVGPQSAGANPGPACYGFGGTEPTATDADLVLGYLNPDYFLGGKMPLSLNAAKKALKEKIAKPLGLDDVQAAWGIHEIVNENMAGAARVHLAEKGKDPRRYALIATGGAGPLHAQRVAKKLQVRKVICPGGAGIASSIGLLVAPPRVDLVHTYVARLKELDWARLNTIYGEMEGEAADMLVQAGVSRHEIVVERTADLRYVGQGYEIVVPIPSGDLGIDSLPKIVGDFQKVYFDLYNRSISGVEIEGVSWRISAYGPAPSIEGALSTQANFARPLDSSGIKGRRSAYLPERSGFAEVTVYDRYTLPTGTVFQGPAIIEERESTALVGADATFHLDQYGNLIIEW